MNNQKSSGTPFEASTAIKRETKPDNVKIVSFMPSASVNSLGGMGLVVWGLGDDNRMYMWDSAKKEWLI
jgi:hypothetical protein